MKCNIHGEGGKEERKYFKICDLIFPRLAAYVFSLFLMEILLEYSNNIVFEGGKKEMEERKRHLPGTDVMITNINDVFIQ